MKMASLKPYKFINNQVKTKCLVNKKMWPDLPTKKQVKGATVCLPQRTQAILIETLVTETGKC